MNEKTAYKRGLTCALLSNFLWGLLPIYWNSLKPIDSFVIIFYRICLMALVCLIATIAVSGTKGLFAPIFESKRRFFTYLLAGVVVTVNWSIYIYAVNAGYVIQTSMGYFIEPLIVCLFGMIFYREHANKWKKTALGFAVVGLMVMIFGYHQLPVMALGLALSFSVYAAVKKSIGIPPLQSLFLETVFLIPIALLFIYHYESTGTGALTVGNPQFLLLLLAGVATAIPLGLFSYAANKLPLITVGLTQYISPSLALILGIFVFHEPFDKVQFAAFALIWLGLVFFTYGEVREQKKQKAEA